MYIRKNEKWVLGGLLLLFLLSRVTVLLNPPYRISAEKGEGGGYSDVKQDYERYANMWKYGLTPYREHLYEYPPVTIPLLLLPLELDLAGLGYYYLNYRLLIFLIESTAFSFFLFYTLKKSRFNIGSVLAFLFYIGCGVVAKDYWYEGLDLVFILAFICGVLARHLIPNRQFLGAYIQWLGFWLSVGIKYMTAPLLLPLLALHKKNLKSEIIACGLAALSVGWLPLILYRSSLAVMFVFHAERPLKYGALGTTIIRTVNDFTGTEELSSIAPHFPWVGPWSSLVETGVKFTFPILMGLIVLWLTWKSWQRGNTYVGFNRKKVTFVLVSTLSYFMVLFLSGKIFSSPFHIWYVPLLTLLGVLNKRPPYWLWLLAIVMLVLDTTPWIKVSTQPLLGPVSLDRIRDWSRFAPMVFMLVWSLRRTRFNGYSGIKTERKI